MPIHIDVKINHRLIERIHVSRLTKNGMSSTSVNEYAVVVGEKKRIRLPDSLIDTMEFPECPDWLEWEESPNRFMHSYGDDAIVCVLKALETLRPDHTSTVREKALEAENARLRAEIEALRAQM